MCTYITVGSMRLSVVKSKAQFDDYQVHQRQYDAKVVKSANVTELVVQVAVTW